MLPRSVFATMRQPSDLYEVPKFGNVSILHITDVHAQLNPIYFREPNVNLGIGSALGKAPHLVGQALLKHFGIPVGGIEAHAFTYLDFDKAATQYGKVGGFAHLKTLVKRVRDSRGPATASCSTVATPGRDPAPRTGRVAGTWWAPATSSAST